MNGIRTTPQADALLAFLLRTNLSPNVTSDALNLGGLLGADIYGGVPRMITANYGFDGYMGVPGLDDTSDASRAAAYQYGVSWQNLDPALQAAARAYYSGVGTDAFLSMYGVDALLADTIPVVFSHPVVTSTLTPEAFRIELNTGEVVTPITASFLPNVEYNERQTVVLSGDWGNRLQPDDPDARYPVKVSIVATDIPLTLATATGLVTAVGLEVASHNPYVAGNGPRMVAANLDVLSTLGEGAPLWLMASNGNSGADLYGDDAQFRLRIYTSAGFSPDGIGSLLPTDFPRYFQLEAIDIHGRSVWITDTDVDYTIDGFGTLRVLGLADTGPATPPYNEAYVEDHDNQYDIILSGDPAAVARLSRVHLPSAGDYSPVYNPGGPGNDPASNPAVPFTVPSSPQSLEVAVLLGQNPYVTFVEIDGSVHRDPDTGAPVGADWGLALLDTHTGHAVHQFMDPNGVMFYASFAVDPNYHLVLDADEPSTHSRATNDHILGTGQVNTVTYQGNLATYQLDFDAVPVVVHDTVARRDGTDYLTAIERLRFNDVALALDTDGNAGQAYRLYGLLNRAPDLEGLGYWLAQRDAGASELTLVQALMQSDEYTSLYRDTRLPGAWVDALYANVLHRDADAAGWQYWTEGLRTGALSHSQVALGFIDSAEYQASVQSQWADGIRYSLWADAAT